MFDPKKTKKKNNNRVRNDNKCRLAKISHYILSLNLDEFTKRCKQLTRQEGNKQAWCNNKNQFYTSLARYDQDKTHKMKQD